MDNTDNVSIFNDKDYLISTDSTEEFQSFVDFMIKSGNTYALKIYLNDLNLISSIGML